VNLIQRWYEAIGFAEPGTEYDTETGTYRVPEAENEAEAA
jgi:hypothetical protein